jgi:hypothetical protein
MDYTCIYIVKEFIKITFFEMLHALSNEVHNIQTVNHNCTTFINHLLAALIF